jgi:hypothetical protein
VLCLAAFHLTQLATSRRYTAHAHAHALCSVNTLLDGDESSAQSMHVCQHTEMSRDIARGLQSARRELHDRTCAATDVNACHVHLQEISTEIATDGAVEKSWRAETDGRKSDCSDASAHGIITRQNPNEHIKEEKGLRCGCSLA